ncbi:MAG: 2-amino-4-hydroxy-6-hydroxymethyldihydropteridine diphosphokinase [Xanthobacteraceae bacterium]
MAEVFLGLGGNLGDRASNLAAARAALARGALTNTSASSIYETEPWGPVPQGRYLNQVVSGSSELPPRALLAKLFEIERALGRDRAREERYGPRTIDLDILLYGDLTMQEPELQIPHPRMMERPFVLVPLAEIAPDLAVNGVAIRDALARLDRTGVVPYRAR